MLLQIHRDVEVFPPPAAPLFEILDSSSPRLDHYFFSNAKLFSGLLVVSIGLVAIAPPIFYPAQAQTQNSGQQELLKLLQQAIQHTQQGQAKEAIATLQQGLALAARRLKNQQAEASAFLGIGINYNNIGQPQKALEFFNFALSII